MENHKEFYRKNLTFLTEHIRVSHILGGLFTQQLISHRDKEELTRLCDRKGDMEAAEKLILEILYRNPDRKSIGKFIQVLRKHSHVEVAEFIGSHFPEFRENAGQATGVYPQYIQPSPSSYTYTTKEHVYPAGAMAQPTYGTQRFAKEEYPFATAEQQSKPNHKLNQDQLFGTTKHMNKYVCHIEYPGGYATGFILGSIPYFVKNQTMPHFVILTNNHVVEPLIKKQYLNDDPDLCCVTAKFTLDPDNTANVHKVYLRSVILSNDPSLDYAMMMLHFDQTLLDTFGTENWLAKFIPNTDTRPSNDEVLMLIGHPKGHDKTIDHAVVKQYVVEQEAIAVQFEPHSVFYDCSSFFGSSGSPCIDVKAKKLYCMQCGDIPISQRRRIEHGVLLYYVVKDIHDKVYSGRLTGTFLDNHFQALFPGFL